LLFIVAMITAETVIEPISNLLINKYFVRLDE